MFRKTRFLIFILIALLVAGCAQTAQAPDTEATGEKGLVIGVIQNQGNYFFQSIQDELQRLASQDGGQIIAVNTNNDVTAEAQAIQDFIQRKVDVILLSTQSPDGSLASVKAAFDAGIPVVCYNSCLSDEDSQKYTKAYIKSDDTDLGFQTGQVLAKYIKDNLDGSAKIAILQCDRFAVCKMRHDGLDKALAGLNVEVVADQEAFLADAAATVAQDILTAHPDMNAFWAENEGGTAGAHAAVSAKTSENKVFVFGTDISPEIAQYLLSDDDIVQATTGQNGIALARASYTAAQKAAAGEAIDPFVQLVPGQLYTREDKAAVQKYLDEAQ